MIKKGKYQFLKVKSISIDSLYLIPKESLISLIRKYDSHNEDMWRFKDSLISKFAIHCLNNQNMKLQYIRCCPFVQYSCERYNEYSDEYVLSLYNRMLNIISSIKKYGYSSGKYSKKLIGIIKQDGQWRLISGKHRAATCVALEISRIRCNLYREIN